MSKFIAVKYELVVTESEKAGSRIKGTIKMSDSFLTVLISHRTFFTPQINDCIQGSHCICYTFIMIIIS